MRSQLYFFEQLETETASRIVGRIVALTDGMRLAVPVWEGRVAPLFDVARRLMVVDVIAGEATFTKVYAIGGSSRQRVVSELCVDVLICGAISRELEDGLVASGVEVVAEIRGVVGDVVRAHTQGSLVQPSYLMPGCHGRRRRARTRSTRPDPVDASERRSAERDIGASGGWFDGGGPEGWMIQ